MNSLIKKFILIGDSESADHYFCVLFYPEKKTYICIGWATGVCITQSDKFYFFLQIKDKNELLYNGKIIPITKLKCTGHEIYGGKTIFDSPGQTNPYIRRLKKLFLKKFYTIIGIYESLYNFSEFLNLGMQLRDGVLPLFSIIKEYYFDPQSILHVDCHWTECKFIWKQIYVNINLEFEHVVVIDKNDGPYSDLNIKECDKIRIVDLWTDYERDIIQRYTSTLIGRPLVPYIYTPINLVSSKKSKMEAYEEKKIITKSSRKGSIVINRTTCIDSICKIHPMENLYKYIIDDYSSSTFTVTIKIKETFIEPKTSKFKKQLRAAKKLYDRQRFQHVKNNQKHIRRGSNKTSR